ncbi:acyl-CoA mutase large subunit family protein [Bacteroidales bacterium OttesenSCG-928-I21]|nr:acyl-CoA mutase large subunit family protein [Bacteroidales bacterium OttesenSCG-928-I21]
MDEKLFQEFPPIPTEAWEEIINKDLKGADYDKKLVWKTLEGFAVKPYYRDENLKNIDYLNTNPNEFPYVRGTKTDNNWEIRQDFEVKNVDEANKFALKLIENGITSLGFVFTKDLNEDEFGRLLKGINIEEVGINFASKELTEKYVQMLIAYAEKNKFDLKKIKGSNDFDALSHMLLHGNTACGESACRCTEEMYFGLRDKLPQFRLISVNAKHFNNAGASVVQELAFGLAMGAEYLQKFISQGYSIDDIAPRIRFNFAVGSNYFMEIAKLRAAKLLWAKIVEANNNKNSDSAKINMHSETSRWNKTVYDPYVNMLRVTTEAMSAILGGTDSLNVLPFNEIYEDASEFSNRIARNVQLVIKEEAHFGKVVDPGAGSYYIENLTDSIVEKTWELFLAVDEKGGFIEAFKSEFIQDSVEATANTRDKNIATRREIILGTNQYPNFTEVRTDVTLDEKCYCGCGAENQVARPLKLYRAAEEFEKLRLKTDKSGKRPVAFMLTIGNLNFRKARAQFGCNFFACAGFEVIDNNGFDTIDAGLAEAKNRNADIIVLCSSDEEYETLAPEAFEKIGNKVLVIAGNPTFRADLEAKGIKNFISVKSNVLEELKEYQKLVGIK